MSDKVDILIIGAGIIGQATALELLARNPKARITIIEKEKGPAQHQSGHNSGVVHAGVYYAPGSLKAKFCRAGLAATKEFCREHKLPYEKTGKLIVATSEDEMTRMKDLGLRARENGVEIEDVDAATLKSLEPHITGLGALLSPSTAITDYGAITAKMAQLFEARGGTIRYGEKVISGAEKKTHVSVITDKALIHAGQVVSCAGLFSDRLISAFGGTPGYQVVPFRGEFYRITGWPVTGSPVTGSPRAGKSDDLVSHLIYPVPDPERPFLGVHLTRKLTGAFTVGPNAVLAFSREGYNFFDVSFKDISETVQYKGFWRMLSQHKKTALQELSASLSKRLYLKRVQKYCPRIALGDLTPYPAGVRAQAVGSSGEIIHDFVFHKTDKCLHVGNAPSPAATAAIPIAQHIADELG